jgi:hypothetical protein
MYEQPNSSITPDIVAQATRHQNLIGWSDFFRGFISKLWIKAHYLTRNITNDKKQPPWHTKITFLIHKLHRNTWEHRNTFVHGTTLTESHKKS